MKNWVRLVLFAVCAPLFLGGCATDSLKTTDPKPVSTIPFNRPESWESQGMLGGMMGGMMSH